MYTPIQLIGDPDEWEIRLVDGSVMTVGAHGFKEEEGQLVFVLFTTEESERVVEVLSIPAGLVSETARKGVGS